MALDNTPLSDHKTSNLKTSNLDSSMDNSQDVDSPLPLLPRSAWTSQVPLLRAVFRAKKALDRIEQEAGVLRG